MGSKVLLHSDNLITGGVFRKPRGVSSMVAENCRGEQTRQGKQGETWKVLCHGCGEECRKHQIDG